MAEERERADPADLDSGIRDLVVALQAVEVVLPAADDCDGKDCGEATWLHEWWSRDGFDCDEGDMGYVKDAECAAGPAKPRTDRPPRVYVASRASVPGRARLWRALRDAGNYPIISTWIDVETVTDRGALLDRAIKEAASATHLILFVEPEDLPLKIAWAELGAALAAGAQVYVVAPDVPSAHLAHIDQHPRVARRSTVELALEDCVAVEGQQ